MDDEDKVMEWVGKISRALQSLDALAPGTALTAQEAVTDLSIYAMRLEGHNAALQQRIKRAVNALGATF